MNNFLKLAYNHGAQQAIADLEKLAAPGRNVASLFDRYVTLMEKGPDYVISDSRIVGALKNAIKRAKGKGDLGLFKPLEGLSVRKVRPSGSGLIVGPKAKSVEVRPFMTERDWLNEIAEYN
jgi:hypothetical protein